MKEIYVYTIEDQDNDNFNIKCKVEYDTNNAYNTDYYFCDGDKWLKDFIDLHKISPDNDADKKDFENFFTQVHDYMVHGNLWEEIRDMKDNEIMNKEAYNLVIKSKKIWGITLSNNKEIQCTVLDGKYEEDDFQVLIKLILIKPYHFEMLSWDGLEWSKQGLNRVYTDKTSQHEYDEFIKRLKSLEQEKIIYEIAEELDEDQTYYFERERIYLYIESKEKIE